MSPSHRRATALSLCRATGRDVGNSGAEPPAVDNPPVEWHAARGEPHVITRAPTNETLPPPKPLDPFGGPVIGQLVSQSPTPISNLPPGQIRDTDQALPINLATALRLSDARPLVIAAAEASFGFPRHSSIRQKYSGFRTSTSELVFTITTAAPKAIRGCNSSTAAISSSPAAA